MACRAPKVIRARRAVAAKAVLFVGLAAELARRVARNEAVFGVARRALGGDVVASSPPACHCPYGVACSCSEGHAAEH